MPMGTGKKKIEIKRKEKESDRMVTFSKRRMGLFKKAHQLHSLSGAYIALLVFSPGKKPYVYGEPSFDATADQYYYSMMMNNNNNKTTSTSGTSIAAEESDINVIDIEDDEDCAETELWRSWLETMEVEEYDQAEDLLVIKKDLEQIRDKFIKRIAASDNE